MDKPTPYGTIYGYRFVKHEVPDFDSLKDSKVYKIMEKINNYIKQHPDEKVVRLSEEDEDWIVEKINVYNTAGIGTIPLRGWAFDFRPVCYQYWIKCEFNGILAVYALTEDGAIRFINKYYDTEILEIR